MFSGCCAWVDSQEMLGPERAFWIQHPFVTVIIIELFNLHKIYSRRDNPAGLQPASSLCCPLVSLVFGFGSFCCLRIKIRTVFFILVTIKTSLFHNFSTLIHNTRTFVHGFHAPTDLSSARDPTVLPVNLFASSKCNRISLLGA